MSSETLIKLSEVGVCYKERKLFRANRENWALRNINLELNRGDTLGVIGRNGVGKSTLLKILANIIEPDRGNISREACTSTLLSLRVGFLNHLNARENAIMSGMLLGLTRAEIEEKLESIIEFAELEEYQDVPLGTFSTGMVARLSFSIAMEIDPEIMLIDEMLAVGDAGFREKSSRAIRQRMQSDKTVVLVAHNDAVIRQLCNHVVWIEDGVTQAEGAADEIVDLYQQSIKAQRALA